MSRFEITYDTRVTSKHLPLRRTTALTKFPPGILHLLTSDSVWNRRNFLSLNDRVGSVVDKVPSAHVPKINSASDSDVLPLSRRSSQLKVSGVKRRRLPRGRSGCDGCDLAAYSCDVTLMNPRYRINMSGIKTQHEGNAFLNCQAMPWQVWWITASYTTPLSKETNRISKTRTRNQKHLYNCWYAELSNITRICFYITVGIYNGVRIHFLIAFLKTKTLDIWMNSDMLQYFPYLFHKLLWISQKDKVVKVSKHLPRIVSQLKHPISLLHHKVKQYVLYCDGSHTSTNDS